MQPKNLLLILVSATLTACGGGGSSSKASTVADVSEDASGSQVQRSSGSQVADCVLTDYQREMLAQLNRVRSVARNCGDQRFEATSPLTFSCSIHPAAQRHSIDMATNNFFSHTGSDGLRVSHRVSATGYEWGVVGENIAAGFDSVGEVMDGWLASEGHCRNIMDSRFTIFAVSRVFTSSADYPDYWTQVFASPR